MQRIVQRTCELMKEHKTDDVRSLGAIDLPTMQKYLNFHFSVSLDLFGQEASTNAANYYTMGVKGRFLETRIDDDHRADRRRPTTSTPSRTAASCARRCRRCRR